VSLLLSPPKSSIKINFPTHHHTMQGITFFSRIAK
jgi:hypothetical protein